VKAARVKAARVKAARVKAARVGSRAKAAMAAQVAAEEPRRRVGAPGKGAESTMAAPMSWMHPMTSWKRTAVRCVS